MQIANAEKNIKSCCKQPPPPTSTRERESADEQTTRLTRPVVVSQSVGSVRRSLWGTYYYYLVRLSTVLYMYMDSAVSDE